MSLTYIEKEIEKIINDKNFEYPLNLAMASAWMLGNQKGINLKILDIQKHSSLADYFILASAGNPTQAKSMADTINKHLKTFQHAPRSLEGFQEANWILLDYGDIIIHIFQDFTRDIYDLDDVWKEATSISIPNEYYSSESDDENITDEGSNKNYF